MPDWLAFDGTNIWVACFDDDVLVELDGSSGALIGMTRVGADPNAVTFDGISLQVSDYGSSTVVAVRASDGHKGRIAGVDAFPLDITFDGTSLWVTCFDSAIEDSGIVDQLQVQNGHVTHRIPIDSAAGVAFDGTNIWVTGGNSNTVSKITRSP